MMMFFLAKLEKYGYKGRSVSGPFFKICIIDLPKIAEGSEVVLFADDTTATTLIAC